MPASDSLDRTFDCTLDFTLVTVFDHWPACWFLTGLALFVAGGLVSARSSVPEANQLPAVAERVIG